MAVYGNGKDYDITLKVGSYLATSTTQYHVVGMQGETTTADWTAYLANNAQTLNDTQTAYYAIGINQDRLSSGSDYCAVRLFGLSKAICESSIAAGDYVTAYSGISTTSHAGHIVGIVADSCSVYGQTVTAFTTVLGRALEDGSTNTVITIFLNPQLYDRNLLGEV